jgi:hypothetical protein
MPPKKIYRPQTVIPLSQEGRTQCPKCHRVDSVMIIEKKDKSGAYFGCTTCVPNGSSYLGEFVGSLTFADYELWKQRRNNNNNNQFQANNLCLAQSQYLAPESSPLSSIPSFAPGFRLPHEEKKEEKKPEEPPASQPLTEKAIRKMFREELERFWNKFCDDKKIVTREEFEDLRSLVMKKKAEESKKRIHELFRSKSIRKEDLNGNKKPRTESSIEDISEDNNDNLTQKIESSDEE